MLVAVHCWGLFLSFTGDHQLMDVLWRINYTRQVLMFI